MTSHSRMLSVFTVMILLSMAAIPGVMAQTSDADARFAQLDSDGDGRISKDEFDKLPVRRADAFKRLDRNGDGAIDRTEFAAFADRRGQGRTNGGATAQTTVTPGKLANPIVALGPPVDIARYRAASVYSAETGGLHLLVMQDGNIVFEQGVEGSTADRAYQIASGTKSFWGPVAAVAMARGLFTLDERVADTISEWQGDPRKSRITVRHLLSFSSGLEAPRRLWADKTVENKGAFAIAQKAVADPGTQFAYSEVHLYAFSEFMRRKLAARLGGPSSAFAFLKETILDPIGLTPTRWATERNGEPAMGHGAVLTAREWAKLGELIRLGGTWNGKQLVRPDLLAACFSSSSANQAYGLTWWLNKASLNPAATADDAGAVRRRSTERISADGIWPGQAPDIVMAAGAGQQRLYVWPSRGLVIVRYSNADMAAAVMGGDYSRMNFSFEDKRFFELLTGVR
ncbi:MAG: serine hydrolase [Methylobacterium sp.]|nr:serine hydrolase [Methylobacterium sp.]